MGADGGSIPTRGELVREGARRKRTADDVEADERVRRDAWRKCALSAEPLRFPARQRAKLAGGGGAGAAGIGQQQQQRAGVVESVAEQQGGEADVEEEDDSTEVCADRLGYLFRKEAVVRALLAARGAGATAGLPQRFAHIRGLRDLVDLRGAFAPESASVDSDRGAASSLSSFSGAGGSGDAARIAAATAAVHGGDTDAPFVCPLSGAEAGSRTGAFSLLANCGHVFSSRVLRELSCVSCPTCDEAIVAGSEWQLNPPEDVRTGLRLELSQRKDTKKRRGKKKEKKSKKEKKRSSVSTNEAQQRSDGEQQQQQDSAGVSAGSKRRLDGTAGDSDETVLESALKQARHD